jgi:hypothetical protein
MSDDLHQGQTEAALEVVVGQVQALDTPTDFAEGYHQTLSNPSRATVDEKSRQIARSDVS